MHIPLDLDELPHEDQYQRVVNLPKELRCEDILPRSRLLACILSAAAAWLLPEEVSVTNVDAAPHCHANPGSKGNRAHLQVKLSGLSEEEAHDGQHGEHAAVAQILGGAAVFLCFSPFGFCVVCLDDQLH